MLKVFIVTLSLTFSLSALAKTDDLVLVGKGSMSWMFLDLYEAKLYSDLPIYEPNHYPQALALTYKRSISKDDLVESTRREWQRLKFNIPTEIDQQLRTLWPDVKNQDTITFRANSVDNGSFYLNGQHIGDLQGPNLAEYFLAIWLSPNTREAKLRAQLIGQKNA